MGEINSSVAVLQLGPSPRKTQGTYKKPVVFRRMKPVPPASCFNTLEVFTPLCHPPEVVHKAALGLCTLGLYLPLDSSLG